MVFRVIKAYMVMAAESPAHAVQTLTTHDFCRNVTCTVYTMDSSGKMKSDSYNELYS